MASGRGSSVILTKLLVFTYYCGIVLLFVGAKCTVSLMENEFKDPKYALTDEVYQEFSDDHTGVKMSAYKDPRYAFTDDVSYQEYSEDNMGIEMSVYKKNEKPYSVKKYPAGCPDNWGPCTCEDITLFFHILEVDCANVADEDELSHVFRNAIYHDTHIHNFRLTGNPKIRVLHPGVFQHITFDQINIGYSKLEKVERGALDSMKSKVKLLDFYWANFYRLEDFPFDEIYTFQKLEELHFTDNKLPGFPDMASESLTMVDFSANPINYIKQDAFRGLPNLEYIYIGGTNIGHIIPGTFKGLPYLKEISLGGNPFYELPAGTIITDSLDLTFLNFGYDLIRNVEPNSISFAPNMLVSLESNPLSTLPEDVWRPLFEQGGTIRGGGLRLECDCGLAWLVLEPKWKANVTNGKCLDGNNIAWLDPSIFEDC